jgi:hypothetical protein
MNVSAKAPTTTTYMDKAGCGQKAKLGSKMVSEALKSELYKQSNSKNSTLKTNVHCTTLMEHVM